MRALRVRAPVLIRFSFWQRVRRVQEWQGSRTRETPPIESREPIGTFLQHGAALTISLGAGTGLHFEDTRHRLALCRRASLERKLEQHSLMSLLTTREVCTTGSGPLERILSRTTRGRTGHEIKN